MTVRAIILCAGNGSRWGNYLGIPKQLISFSGESILARQIRLLNTNGVADILCVTLDERLEINGAKQTAPSCSDFLADTIISSSPSWTKCTIILLGDVFFTARAMRKIIRSAGPVTFFGRPWASELVGCRHGELFALKVRDDAHNILLGALKKTRELAAQGARGNLWDIYHTLCGLPLNSGQAETDSFLVIDDVTNDFDRPEEFAARNEMYSAITSGNPVRHAFALARLGYRLPAHIAARRPVSVMRSSLR